MKGILKKKVMKNGIKRELGCYGNRRCNSIPDRVVYLRSSGSGNTSHHCDGNTGDNEILVTYRLAARFGRIRTIQKIRLVFTGGLLRNIRKRENPHHPNQNLECV